ncbi:MAG TPA: hypothetical protein PKC72_14655 [Chitinophagaceae bacterium]|nr:hypothetical protein [Chitinophagaceae bacterium]
MPLILNSQTGDHTSGISRSLYIPEERNTSIKIGDREVKISILQYGSKKDILYINLHDNETTSFLAAKSVLEEQGGTLINIENNNQRVIRFRLNGINYGFDPNRIYSSAGIGQTLRDNRRYSRDAANAIEKFASQVLALITDSISCIVALHNNFDGGFSVNSYLNGGERQKDARSVYVDSLQDNDDIAFTTDSLLFQKMAEKGFNSIWQDNINAKRDGSLSIYCGENNIRYINIETEHGRSEQYIEMLERLVSILKDEKRTSPTNEEN